MSRLSETAFQETLRNSLIQRAIAEERDLAQRSEFAAWADKFIVWYESAKPRDLDTKHHRAYEKIMALKRGD